MKKCLAAALLCAALLSGCMSLPITADRAAAVEPVHMAQPSGPDDARVTVVREGGILGAVNPMSIYIESLLVAALSPAEKTTVYVRPGGRFVMARMGYLDTAELIDIKPKSEIVLYVSSVMGKGLSISKGE
ncbi:hypothetical protein [Sutterella sp.]|uniref:hypothetical protein n=1 Tax=Sutterella sp. TaxID=1981025 RepID=UPI003FD867F9